MPMQRMVPAIVKRADSTKNKLRLQAARHGRSLAEEARVILRQATTESSAAEVREGLGSRIQAHFARLGAVALELPDRSDHPCDPPFA